MKMFDRGSQVEVYFTKEEYRALKVFMEALSYKFVRTWGQSDTPMKELSPTAGETERLQDMAVAMGIHT